MSEQNNIPVIDPRIEYVGASRLRTLNTANLGKLDKMLVIQDNDKPLAVLLNYEQYLIIQNKLQSLLKTVELVHPNQVAGLNGLKAGLQDDAADRTIPASQVREGVRQKRG